MGKSRVVAEIFVAKLLPISDKNSHFNFCNGSIIFPSRTLG